MSDLIKESKRHPGYIYWWDISPGLKEKLANSDYDSVVFVELDTGTKHTVRTQDLLELLTEECQTTRGRKNQEKGNWGIKILWNDPNTLWLEKPGENCEKWVRIPEMKKP